MSTRRIRSAAFSTPSGTIAEEMPVVFPVHPRTRQRLKEFGLDVPPGLLLTDPLGYIDFLSLTSHARIHPD